MPTRASPAACSPAMANAARRELTRLARANERLDQRRAALTAQLADLDADLAAHHRRLSLLRELAGEGTPPATVKNPPRGAVTVVGGRALRVAAGKLLWQQRQAAEIHYREWFERLLAARYAISGRDPLASFLTNVRGSAAVTRGRQPGHYRLDLPAHQHHQHLVQRLEAERLRSDLGGQRDALERQLRAARRDLAELDDIFDPDQRKDNPCPTLPPIPTLHAGASRTSQCETSSRA